MNPTSFSSWWGRHSIEANRVDLWQVGPLKLWVQHLQHQWNLHWTHGNDWLDASVRTLPGSRAELPPADAQIVQCAFGGPSREDVIFSPALPDRPLISHLKTPLEILPEETVQLFVVFPLWLRVELAHPSKLLQEIPTFRLSDTWFGPMSSDGELCYSSTTPALLDLSNVPLRLHCAISSIAIRNFGADSLRLDRIRVPMQHLSLFFSPRTGFWTNALTLVRRDNEMADVKLEKSPPAEVAPSQFVTAPRVPPTEAPIVVRAFSAFFRDRSSI